MIQLFQCLSHDVLRDSNLAIRVIQGNIITYKNRICQTCPQETECQMAGCTRPRHELSRLCKEHMQQFIEQKTTPKPQTILQQTFAAVTEQDRNYHHQTDCARTLFHGERADDESSYELEESDNCTNQDDDQNQDGSRDLINSEADDINNDFNNDSDHENYHAYGFDDDVSGQGGGSPLDFELWTREEQQQVLDTNDLDQYFANISHGNDQVEPELFDARLVNHTDSIHGYVVQRLINGVERGWWRRGWERGWTSML
jgi:hypothetical protein